MSYEEVMAAVNQNKLVNLITAFICEMIICEMNSIFKFKQKVNLSIYSPQWAA